MIHNKIAIGVAFFMFGYTQALQSARLSQPTSYSMNLAENLFDTQLLHPSKNIYDTSTKHFYQGVLEANKWQRVDNGAIYPAGDIGGYLLVSPDPNAEYTFSHYFNENQSCDDPELLGRIIGKLQELAEQKCLYLHPRDRGRVVAVHFNWGRNNPEPNPCGFKYESQTVSFGCGGIGL